MADDGSITIKTLLDSDGLKKGLNTISGIAKTALKGIAVTAGAVTTAFAGIVTASVNARGELEQQIGGVKTLFANELGDASETVIANANKAYQTAGMSAIDYMNTATSFSASLLQSLGGDTTKAAQITDMAIIDMSDNANKMGTSIEAIQNAYQGFAKQNYTMLDNLKLGYGGTKTEMERLLSDAQKISGVKYDISNLSDVYNAIHVVQEELGIAGATAEEASTTLQGSFSSMKAAWSNFLSGSGDLSQVVDVATDVVKNIVRIVDEAMPDIMNSITEAMPDILKLGGEILQKLIDGIIEYLPTLMQTAGQIIDELINGIINALPTIFPVISQIFEQLFNAFIEYLPQIMNIGMQLISELILGLSQMLPELIPEALNVIMTLVEGFLDNIDLMIDSGIQLLLGLTDGIINALPQLIEKVPVILEKFIDAIVRNLPKIVKAGGEILGKLVVGILGSIIKLVEVAPKLISTLVEGIENGVTAISEVGQHLIEGLWNGISGMGNWLKDRISDFASGIINNFKSMFGINSPSKVFAKEIGRWLPPGIYNGFEDALPAVFSKMKAAIENETGKLSSTVSATVGIKNIGRDSETSSQDTTKDVSIINNFYEKVQSPYETAKQTRNTVRRIVYGY